MRTNLRFVHAPMPVLPALCEPKTVVIDFDGRQFGWVMMAAASGDRPSGPTLTTIVSTDTEEGWSAAREAAQRLLSALTFLHDTSLVAAATSGGSGEPDLIHPYGFIESDMSRVHQFAEAPAEVFVDQNRELRLALAVYREGVNATSPFYGFLAYWNVLDVVFSGNETARDGFLRREAAASQYAVSAPGDIAERFRQDSRNAIAHVIRQRTRDVSLDPDLPPDRERLRLEQRWLGDIARSAVDHAWPNAVRAR